MQLSSVSTPLLAAILLVATGQLPPVPRALGAAEARSWTDNLFGAASKPPHPAVVRVIATNGNGASLGSGALVAVSERHGLVVTNWHVVRDATGAVIVAFPDGFRSPAMVLKTDREWDLAALATWRPQAPPIPVAVQPARPGEPLTIAGYGSGSYREVTGRCTQYVSPGANQPFEMVELSAGARQGDSGGPILNQRGELAGVLFGAAFGQTTGSYCGRVRTFLASVSDDFHRLHTGSTMVAQAASPPPSAPAAPASPSPPSAPAPTASIAAAPPFPSSAAALAPMPQFAPGSPASLPPPAPGAPPPPAEPTLFEQLRNFFAALGVFAVFFHALRLFGGGEK